MPSRTLQIDEEAAPAANKVGQAADALKQFVWCYKENWWQLEPATRVTKLKHPTAANFVVVSPLRGLLLGRVKHVKFHLLVLVHQSSGISAGGASLAELNPQRGVFAHFMGSCSQHPTLLGS